MVYIDDWEGKYKLIEMNRCCDVKTKVRLGVVKNGNNRYLWEMFFDGDGSKDTMKGKAIYAKNRVQFYLNNGEIANRYFKKGVQGNSSVFWMEYDNYYTDSSFKYIGYFTRWNNQLKGYKSYHSLFSGVDYNFKIEGKDRIMITGIKIK